MERTAWERHKTFSSATGLVEVKTVLPGAHSVSISSAEQLENGSTPLQLAVVAIDTSKGISPVELVARSANSWTAPGCAHGVRSQASRGRLYRMTRENTFISLYRAFATIRSQTLSPASCFLELPAGSPGSHTTSILQCGNYRSDYIMQLDDYRKEFLEDIRARASVASNFTHTEFVDVCADLLSEAEELSDFESCYFRGSGSRNKISGRGRICARRCDGSIRLVIADFSGSEEMQNLTQTQARGCSGS